MRQDIVAIARSWLGTPYRHQAALKGVGCDCLGLLRGIYAETCGQSTEEPPPYSRDWAEAARRETLIEAAARHLRRIDAADAEPGDVLIFRMRPGAMAKHCAILSERGLSANEPSAARDGDAGRQNPAAAASVMKSARATQPKFIHAIEGAPVCEIHLSPWWRRRVAAAFRFPDPEN